MPNFKQICQIQTKYKNNRDFLINSYYTSFGQRVCKGKIWWNIEDGHSSFKTSQWLNFYTYDEEVMNKLLCNQGSKFELEGELEIVRIPRKGGFDMKDYYEVKVEVYLNKASLYINDNVVPNLYE